MDDIRPDSAQTDALLEAASRGEAQAVEQLLARCRLALRAFVEARFDPQLAARLDPSDVVQEAQLAILRRLPEFLERRPMPFHLWVRKTAYERLLNARRAHLTAARRAVAREVPQPDRSSLLLAQALLASGPSPSEQVQAREFAERLSRAVADLDEPDQEILRLRHVDDLPYQEIGCLLEVAAAVARKRYGRALLRLRKALSEHGLLEGQP
jgi:RNA polymerase sigma-70 factor (ECF subfamily)